MTVGEDGSRIRSGNAPQLMAALRNAVRSLLRLHGCTNVAAGLRQIASQHTALPLLRRSL